jgi:hypothetical protein
MLPIAGARDTPILRSVVRGVMIRIGVTFFDTLAIHRAKRICCN